MIAILENPEVRRLVGKISVQQYEQLGESVDGTRTELIRGVLIEEMAPSPPHAFLITRLYRWVLAAVGTAFYCRQEQPLKLHDSMPQPDLVVIDGREDDFFDEHPTTALWVMEVAISSAGLDREKASLYAEAGIEEYWILLVGEKAVEVHTAAVAGEYTQRKIYRSGEILVSTVLPALRVDLEALFRR